MKGNEKMAYTINQRVAIYRKMANLTQTEAAERLGMNAAPIRRWSARAISV